MDTVVVALPLGAVQADVYDARVEDDVGLVRADAVHGGPLEMESCVRDVVELAILKSRRQRKSKSASHPQPRRWLQTRLANSPSLHLG